MARKKRFGVSPIINTIYYGTQNTEDHKWVGEKTDVTNDVITESKDIGEKRYYLVAPNGLLFHEIPFSETGILTREVWVSRCPSCGKVRGYSYSKNEAKENGTFCEGCIRKHRFLIKKFFRYRKKSVKFDLLIKGNREYKGIVYPYIEIKQKNKDSNSNLF